MGCFISRIDRQVLDYCNFCGIANDTLFIIESLGKHDGKKICMCCLLSNRKYKENYTCGVCKENCDEIIKVFKYGEVKQMCRNCYTFND